MSAACRCIVGTGPASECRHAGEHLCSVVQICVVRDIGSFVELDIWNGGELLLDVLVRWRGDLVWPDSEVHRRELTIRASRNATKDDFAHVMASIEAGLVPTGQLATHATGFAEVAQFLPLWAKDRSGLIKAIVRL